MQNEDHTPLGRAFLLKIGNGESPVVYTTVAGLRTVEHEIEKDRMKIIGSGVFTGSAAEGRIKSNALAGTSDDYRLSFETGETYTGRFLVTRLGYAGDFNGERSYDLTLESVGKVTKL